MMDEANIDYWAERAEACSTIAAELDRTRKTIRGGGRPEYRKAADIFRLAARRSTSDLPGDRESVNACARDGAHFEALAHQRRHELDGTQAPAEHATHPPALTIDPASIHRIDTIEYWNPFEKATAKRATLGTAPDGTPVVVYEDIYDEADGLGAARGVRGQLTEDDMQVVEIRAYASTEDARRDRDAEMRCGLIPSELAHLRTTR
ncbi:hypothetical protein [Actinomadura sp. 3N407]|uniref:hypothetical protein n=1 Tax=Actinomadura sp. 3N407 TaxID=3457423 RepID=UPI003FCE098B